MPDSKKISELTAITAAQVLAIIANDSDDTPYIPLVDPSVPVALQNKRILTTQLQVLFGGVTHEFAGGAAPTVTDDSGDGFSEGSLWFHGGVIYMCYDPAVSNAVWKRISNPESAVQFVTIDAAAKTEVVEFAVEYDTAPKVFARGYQTTENELPNEVTVVPGSVTTTGCTVVADDANHGGIEVKLEIYE